MSMYSPGNAGFQGGYQPGMPGAPDGRDGGAAGYTHRRAAPALMCGALSLVLCGLFTGVPAMVMGRQAIRDIDASGGQVGGRGLALTGVVLGALGTLLSLVLLAGTIARR